MFRGNKDSETLRKFLGNVRKILKYMILRKFRKKFFPHVGANLTKYVIGNFEVVSCKCQENYETEDLGKICKKFFTHFENNLRKYVFESIEGPNFPLILEII